MAPATGRIAINSPIGPGGGIYNSGTLMVTDCVITLNTSSTGGAGIFHVGPNFEAGGTLSVFGTTFSYNSGSAGSSIEDDYGGAVTIANSSFVGNITGGCCGTVDNINSGQNGSDHYGPRERRSCTIASFRIALGHLRFTLWRRPGSSFAT